MPAHAAKATSDGLRFEQVFGTRGEPKAMHFTARYTAGGAPHVLEVWRDADSRLVRRTDDAIETHVARQPGDSAYGMVVLDLRRKIETRIARDDLYRIGQFTDWFDLGHGLRHPKSAYRLTAISTPTPAPRPIGPCDWYALTRGGHVTKVCWSTRERLPLLMLGDDDRPLWQLTSMDHKPIAAAVFEIRDHDFVRNDAGQDISGD